jgi:hypothetical protein
MIFNSLLFTVYFSLFTVHCSLFVFLTIYFLLPTIFRWRGFAIRAICSVVIRVISSVAIRASSLAPIATDRRELGGAKSAPAEAPCPVPCALFYLLTFAHVSFKETVLLKTSLDPLES